MQLLLLASALAADHAEAPLAAVDPAADIADLYAWNNGDKLVLVLTYAPLQAAGAEPVYDAEVAYTFHIDTDEDFVADQEIVVQTGQNGAGDWGVQVRHGDTTHAAPVAETAGDEQLKAWIGLRDDPFFFDLFGFNDTMSTGTLAFTGADALAGTNVMAIVVEVELEQLGDPSAFRAWATTARK